MYALTYGGEGKKHESRGELLGNRKGNGGMAEEG
jgi:hypothetical protein